jgi:hypothetical protein
VNNNVTSAIDWLGGEGYYYYKSNYYYYSDINLFIGGQAKTQINNFNDALSHYRSGAGGVVSAGTGLYAEMTNASSYISRISGNSSVLAGWIENRLKSVSRNQTTGLISATPGSFIGQLNSTTLGSYGFNIAYQAQWDAGSWYEREGKNYRLVAMNVTVNLANITDWNFDWNANYGIWKNITQELIPGWIAGARGNPSPFEISIQTSETYNLVVEQAE